jgi:polyphosphate glucokinase
MQIFGVDIGGSAIKGALVDLEQGLFVGKRIRFETGPECTPVRHGELASEMVRTLRYSGPVGIGFPGPIKNGIPWMAVNLHQDWVNLDAAGLFSRATGCDCFMLNDADAAGLAEIKYGAGRDFANKVIFICTLGTGIGSAIFVDGHLLPNSEFGHLEIHNADAETLASDAVRREKDLSWKKWAKRLQEYFAAIEKLLSPDLIIIGGGVSKYAEKYIPFLNLKAQVVPAMLLNDAGIIGAALYAYQQAGKKR